MLSFVLVSAPSCSRAHAAQAAAASGGINSGFFPELPQEAQEDQAEERKNPAQIREPQQQKQHQQQQQQQQRPQSQQQQQSDPKIKVISPEIFRYHAR